MYTFSIPRQFSIYHKLCPGTFCCWTFLLSFRFETSPSTRNVMMMGKMCQADPWKKLFPCCDDDDGSLAARCCFMVEKVEKFIFFIDFWFLHSCFNFRFLFCLFVVFTFHRFQSHRLPRETPTRPSCVSNFALNKPTKHTINFPRVHS